jgi:predicted MFS family arabinose efflux permease
LDSQPAAYADRRVSLLLLGAAAFLVSLGTRILDPLLKILAEREFNVPLDRAALTVSAYTLPYGLCQLIYGPLGDRLGKVRVMAGAFTLCALGTMACAFVPSDPEFGMGALILLRFITGVAAAALIPLSIAYIGDKFPPERRQATLGQFMSSLMLGVVFSGPVGGIFGEYLGWRKIFLLLGGVSLFVALVLLNAARSEPRPKRDADKPRVSILENYRIVLSNPNSVVVNLGIFLEGLFLFGGFVFLSTAMQQNFQMKLLYAGLLLSFYGIGGLIYSLTAKQIVARLQQWQMALLGGALLTIGFLIMAALPSLHHWWPFIPAALLMGIGFNSLHSTLQTKATELAPKARGTAVSLFAFFFFLGQSIGVQGGGMIVKNPHYGFAADFLIAGIGLLLMASWAAYRLMTMGNEPGAERAQSAPS